MNSRLVALSVGAGPLNIRRRSRAPRFRRPAVGYSRTITSANAADAAPASDWSVLEQQANAARIDLIVKGTIDGDRRGLLYRPATNDYRTDRTGVGPFTRTQLREKIAAGDSLTVMGVPPGSGTRMGIDRDVDGVLDGDVGMPMPPVIVHVADVRTTDSAGNTKVTFRRRDTVFWRVLVSDGHGDPVAGASVETRIALGGTPVGTFPALTGVDGWALFSRPAQNDATGTYTIAVTAVSKDGATYDASVNLESTTTYTLKR